MDLKITERKNDMHSLFSKSLYKSPDRFSDQYGEFLNFLLTSIIKEEDNENLVFSPYSIITLLSIAADATAGNTQKEITDVLCGPNNAERFRKSIINTRNLLEKLPGFSNANAVCVKKEFANTISQDFRKLLKSDWQGNIFTSEKMISDINAWVHEKTNGLIDHIADDTIGELVFCLMNVVAFESEWKVQYKDTCANIDYFHNADGSAVLTDMLSSFEDHFVENCCYTGFIKPYKDENFSFMTLLPKAEGRTAFYQAMGDADFTELFKTRMKFSVHAEIPEFSISDSFNLKELFCRAGIRRIFSSDADFSPMSSKKLKAEEIYHKARIDVDRKGTIAAAAATMMSLFGAAPDLLRPRYVCLNRPFLFAVIHNKTGLPVFTGAVKHIEGKRSKSCQ